MAPGMVKGSVWGLIFHKYSWPFCMCVCVCACVCVCVCVCVSQVKALEIVWCCWYLVLLVAVKGGDSLEVGHFNHLNGRLIVSSLTSECKASAWKTQQTQRGRESVTDRRWWWNTDDSISLHTSEKTVSSHFTLALLRPDFISLCQSRGESKLQTTYSHHSPDVMQSVKVPL